MSLTNVLLALRFFFSPLLQWFSVVRLPVNAFNRMSAHPHKSGSRSIESVFRLSAHRWFMLLRMAPGKRRNNTPPLTALLILYFFPRPSVFCALPSFTSLFTIVIKAMSAYFGKAHNGDRAEHEAEKVLFSGRVGVVKRPSVQRLAYGILQCRTERWGRLKRMLVVELVCLF